MKRQDHTAEIVRLVAQVVPASAFSPPELEHALRAKYGGKALHISERAPVTVERINEGLAQRQSVVAIAEATGVHRATIYRMLGRKKSQAKARCDNGGR